MQLPSLRPSGLQGRSLQLPWSLQRGHRLTNNVTSDAWPLGAWGRVSVVLSHPVQGTLCWQLKVANTDYKVTHHRLGVMTRTLLGLLFSLQHCWTRFYLFSYQHCHCFLFLQNTQRQMLPFLSSFLFPVWWVSELSPKVFVQWNKWAVGVKLEKFGKFQATLKTIFLTRNRKFPSLTLCPCAQSKQFPICRFDRGLPYFTVVYSAYLRISCKWFAPVCVRQFL